MLCVSGASFLSGVDRFARAEEEGSQRSKIVAVRHDVAGRGGYQGS